MNRARTVLVALAVVAALATGLHLLQRQLVGASFAFGSHPDVIDALESSLEDQRAIARLDPEQSEARRTRFEEIEATLHRLQILEHSRDAMIERVELLLLLLGTTAIALGGGLWVYLLTRREARLQRVDAAIGQLAAGQTDLTVAVRGHDTAGRIARMIERTSRLMARDRRRLAALRNLSAWQEAARRHAHEMRTPLTGLRLEIDHLERRLASEPELASRVRSARQELERLTSFTQGFASFAKLPEPRLVPRDVTELVEQVARTYEEAWPGVELRVEAGLPVFAAVDRDLFRQVLVNLCDNAALAGAATVTIAVETTPGEVLVRVGDDGGGIPPPMQERLFEPYSSTRVGTGGTGLGLAISRKILLDHGGEIALVRTSLEGTELALSLPRVEPEASS